MIRQQSQKAKASGEIISLTNVATEASTMRSTFSSISATVTAMRSSGAKPQERAVTVRATSAMIGFSATKMVINTDDNTGVDKIMMAEREVANGRKVKVSINPFAQGGMRNVYRMELASEEPGSGAVILVGKESRHNIHYNERLRFHLETVSCQRQAFCKSTCVCICYHGPLAQSHHTILRPS